MKKKDNRYIYFLISCLSVIAVIVLWYVLVDVMKITKASVFPGVEKVCTTFVSKLTSKKPDGATLPQHLLESLKVCLMGYSIGAVLGIPIGIAMAWSKWCDWIVRPVFDLIRPVPGLAWTPMFILIFGIGIEAKADRKSTRLNSSHVF